MRMSLRVRRPASTTIIVAVTFVTNLYFYLPVLTLYYQSRGLNILQINALHALLVTTQFVAEVPTGILADRLGRKRTVLAALLLQLLGEVLFLLARDIWLFAVVSLLAGLNYAFASGSIEALVYESLLGADRDAAMKRAMGRIGAALRMANLLAYAASGPLMANLQPARYTLGIALTASAVGLGCFLALLLREPQSRDPARGRVPSLALLRGGVAELVHNPRLRRIVLLEILSDPLGFYLIILYQPYFVRAGVPGAWFGISLTAGSLLAALCERYAYVYEERLGMRRGLLLGTALPGLLYLAMAPVRQPALAVGLFCLQYGTMRSARPLLRAYINAYIASERRATVLSLIHLGSSVYLSLAGLALGLIADRSLTVLFAVMGAVVLVSASLLRVDERHVAAGPERAGVST